MTGLFSFGAAPDARLAAIYDSSVKGEAPKVVSVARPAPKVVSKQSVDLVGRVDRKRKSAPAADAPSSASARPSKKKRTLQAEKDDSSEYERRHLASLYRESDAPADTKPAADKPAPSKPAKAPKPPVDKSSPERLARTIFVGNVPTAALTKAGTRLLRSRFAKFGAVESLRFRSVAVSDPTLPRRVAIEKGLLHDGRDSSNAYIVYVDRASAEAALAANGELFELPKSVLASVRRKVRKAATEEEADNDVDEEEDVSDADDDDAEIPDDDEEAENDEEDDDGASGFSEADLAKHIRVDMADGSSTRKKEDMNRTVFVGNLPFSATDEAVRAHFATCGPVEYVRVVRDKATALGKGFAYVCFSDKAAVALAVKLNGAAFMKRPLRVSRARDSESLKLKKSHDAAKQKERNSGRRPVRLYFFI